MCFDVLMSMSNAQQFLTVTMSEKAITTLSSLVELVHVCVN